MAMTQRNPGLFSGNRFKLGGFAFNVSGGLALVDVPERWDASWDNNLAVAQMADAAGIECLVPLQRWKGYGGDTDYQGAGAGLSYVPCGRPHPHISVFATVHSAWSSRVAAKQAVTADMIGRGRFGPNRARLQRRRIPHVRGGAWRSPDRHTQWDRNGGTLFAACGLVRSISITMGLISIAGVIGRPRPYGDQNPPMITPVRRPLGEPSRCATLTCTTTLHPSRG
jgi:hypothetical protein